MTEDDALLISKQVADAVAHAVADGRRVIDAALYNRPTDAIVLLCHPFAVMVDRALIPELRTVPHDAMETIALSPSGATLMIESHNIYIEAAGLVAEFIMAMRQDKNKGGLILDLLRQ
jgi:hypothetical protein